MNDFDAQLTAERSAYREKYLGKIVELTKSVAAGGGVELAAGTRGRVINVLVRGNINAADGIERDLRVEFPDRTQAKLKVDILKIVDQR